MRNAPFCTIFVYYSNNPQFHVYWHIIYKRLLLYQICPISCNNHIKSLKTDNFSKSDTFGPKWQFLVFNTKNRHEYPKSHITMDLTIIKANRSYLRRFTLKYSKITFFANLIYFRPKSAKNSYLYYFNV